VAVPAGPPERYFVDESMLSIAKDVDWLPIVRGRGWAVIMRDKRIRRRPVERQRFLDHGVRAFCLTGAGNQTSWQILQLIVRHWDRIEVASARPAPFIFAVTATGLSSQPIAA
jgi:hypothetical protein